MGYLGHNRLKSKCPPQAHVNTQCQLVVLGSAGGTRLQGRGLKATPAAGSATHFASWSEMPLQAPMDGS